MQAYAGHRKIAAMTRATACAGRRYHTGTNRVPVHLGKSPTRRSATGLTFQVSPEIERTLLHRAVVRCMEAVVHAGGEAQRDEAAVAPVPRRSLRRPAGLPACTGSPWPGTPWCRRSRPQAPTMASTGLLSTRGSVCQSARGAVLQFAGEAVVHAGEVRAVLASLRSRSVKILPDGNRRGCATRAVQSC